MNTPKHVLDGYKVLDFSQIIAGPTCTLMLAEMGAEVIKVELTPAGDHARVGPIVVDGRSAYFVQHNRGKKGLCLDAKTPEGLAILKGLVAKVDVMLENYAPGVIGRLGLGYDVVSKINPRLVMCSISRLWSDRSISTRTRVRLGRRGVLRNHINGRRERRTAPFSHGSNW